MDLGFINSNMYIFQGMFLLGLFFESLRTIPFAKRWRRIVLLLVVAVFGGLLPGKHEYNYDLHMHLWVVGVFYSFLLFAAFTQELLPNLSELDLILETLCLWTITTFGSTISVFTQFAPYMNFVGLIILLYVLLPFPANKYMEIALYAWIIFLTICIMIIQYWWFLSFPFYQSPTLQSILTMITSGMAGFILIRNFTILWELLPLPGKHQSFAQRWKQLRQYVRLIRHKFDDRQLSPIPAILFTGSLISIILINEYYHLVPQSTIILFLLIAGQYIKGFRELYLVPPAKPNLPR